MADLPEIDVASRQIQLLNQALASGRLGPVRRMLATLRPPEIAHLLESLPKAKRLVVWNLVDSDDDGEVLVEVSEDVRADLIAAMDPDELVAATEDLEIDDLAEILDDLPEAVITEVLDSMDRDDRERLERALSFPEDSAGRVANPEVVTVRAEVTVDVVLRYLRLRGELPENTNHLYVVSRTGQFQGRVPLAALVTAQPEDRVGTLIDEELPTFRATDDLEQVAKEFQTHGYISAAVIDGDNSLVGRITVDDVLDIIREQADHSLLSLSGLPDEADLFSPFWKAAWRRTPWLGVNLITASTASFVIGRFEATLEQVVALAILMPVVASMGGIAGTQTLTLIVRGMALGQVSFANAKALFFKELGVGALNGLVWALIVGVAAGVRFGNAEIALVIAIAILVNLLLAAVGGVLVPLLLRRFKVDPALGGGVLLTTITDVGGFFVFLAVGTLILLR